MIEYPKCLFNKQYKRESRWIKFLRLIGIEMGD